MELYEDAILTEISSIYCNVHFLRPLLVSWHGVVRWWLECCWGCGQIMTSTFIIDAYRIRWL